MTVVPSNGDELCRQWLDVHGLEEDDAQVHAGHREWRDASGAVAVQQFVVERMGHGAPIDSKGENACGSAAPFVLEAGISSSLVMAEQWGLTDGGLVGEVLEFARKRETSAWIPDAETSNAPKLEPRSFIARTIHDALQKAGLLKR